MLHSYFIFDFSVSTFWIIIIIHIKIHKMYYYYHVRNWPQVRKKKWGKICINAFLTQREKHIECIYEKSFASFKRSMDHYEALLFLSVHMNKRKLCFTVARQIFTQIKRIPNPFPFRFVAVRRVQNQKLLSNGINIIRINLFVLNCWKFIQCVFFFFFEV